METQFRKIGLILFSVLLMAVVFFTGVYVGMESIPEESKVVTLHNTSENKPDSVDFSPFWKTWNVINEKFVPVSTTTQKATDEDRVWGAISGLTDSLEDPYTVFLPPVESKVFEEDISGNFEGVGMEIGIRENILTVISPLKNTPAYKAGVKSGDIILEINGNITADMSVEEAVKLIRGERGTKVKLTLFRDNNGGEPFSVEIVRDVIDIPATDSYLRDDGIFVIHLYNFSAISANEFRMALRDFILSDTDRLILDLRGNAGGFLKASIEMASWFLPAGDVVVKEDFGSKNDPDVYRSKGHNVFGSDLKMVILVDGGTASASEILAGALREHGVATLVGTQTFGKGSVQELVPITSDTNLKVTVARWLTPNGTSISQNGLVPDSIVEAGDSESGDLQMERAVEIVSQQR